jgi:Alkylmercury lyase
MTNSAPEQATEAQARPWTPDALGLINFVYGFWAGERRPPTFLDIYEEFHLSPRRVRRLFRELQEGFGLTSQDQLIGFGIDKAPPFSATPTTIAAFTDGVFLSYVGCPMEGLTIGALPPLESKVITLRSYCACCFMPIELEVRGQEVLSASPVLPLISVVRSPYDWEGGVSAEIVCDSFHYVLDETHAERFGRRILRRGMTMTMDQARLLTTDTAARRMKDPHFPQIRIEAEPMIAFLERIGVDTAVWEAA